MDCWSSLEVELDARGNVATDANYMSSVPGVFAAGDMRRGQSLVVWAISEGRKAAEGVDHICVKRLREPGGYRAPVEAQPRCKNYHRDTAFTDGAQSSCGIAVN